MKSGRDTVTLERQAASESVSWPVRSSANKANSYRSYRSDVNATQD